MTSSLAPTLFSKKSLRRLFIAGLFLSAFALSYFRAFDLYELQTYDLRCQVRGQRPVSPDIVLIDIWDDTLQSLGQFPLDREYYAILVEALAYAGARVVAFDILFAEPGEKDVLVTSSAVTAGNVYFSKAFGDQIEENGVIYSTKITVPLLKNYEQSAKGVGLVNVKADADGKRRRVPLTIFYKGKMSVYLGLKLALDVMGMSEHRLVVHPGRSVELPGYGSIPLDSEGLFLVNYAGKWTESFRHYSFKDVLYSYYQKSQLGEKPMIDLDQLRGKICIVGLTATASHDINANPLERVYPNVGVHANVLNSILMRDFIRRLTPVQNLLILLVLSGIVFFVSLKLKPIRALVHTVSVILIYAMAAILLFSASGVWMDLFFPLILSVSIYIGTTLTKIISEMKKRQLIENELKVASQIQKSFLPEKLPEIKGLSLAVFFKPAKAVGGDLYAFIPFDASAGQKIGVMLGDVSGKGTPAALFMAKVVSEFKFSSRGKAAPSAALTDLNTAISSESTGGLFVTLTYVIFDLASRKLVLSNGGHLPLILATADNRAEFLTAEEGMPIGVMEGVSFSDFEKEIRPGDCFAFYSDGVSEGRNKKKEEYGAETLLGMISKHRSGTAQEILDKAIKSLEEFIGKAEQHDDITLIVAKVESLG